MTLPLLHPDQLAKPARLQPKIIQFGGGNFLRAFVGWMIQRLNHATTFAGGIILVKSLPGGRYQTLLNQGGLYHVLSQGVMNGEKTSQIELINNITEIIHPHEEWDSFLSSARIPSIRFIASNTTEAGIQFDDEEAFAQVPSSFPGKLTHWLWERFQHFRASPGKGCYLLPCELIENNAEQLKECILKYIEHWNLPDAFRLWIDQHNFFCNTLVDRIVTGFPQDQSGELWSNLGFRDEGMVAAEPYHLWAIEPSHQLEVELPLPSAQLNVIYTKDIARQRTLKVRILNGLHTAMVPVGYLMGAKTVKQVMDTLQLQRYLEKLLQQEIFPTLDYSDEQLQQYGGMVFDRFRNPFVHHYLMDIALNSLSKWRERLLPTLLSHFRSRAPIPQLLVLTLASLLILYRGAYDDEEIPLRDEAVHLTFFSELWKALSAHTLTIDQLGMTVLANSELWGQNLNKLPGLTKSLNQFLRLIFRLGIESVFEQLEEI